LKDYSNAFFKDMDKLYENLTERMFKQFRAFEEAIRTGEIKGTWEVRPIERPGVKGYVAHGQFQVGNAPFMVPKEQYAEKRDPLTDVFEKEDHIEIYMELPGVEKEDIQLNVIEDIVEVKAKDFFKRVTLPTQTTDPEKSTSKYRNGVLEINVPKRPDKKDEKPRKKIKIE
jgi:HSP20 family protein